VNKHLHVLAAIAALCLAGKAQAQDSGLSLESTNTIRQTQSWGKIALDSGDFRYIPVSSTYDNPSTRGTIIVQPRREAGGGYFIDAYTTHFSCGSRKLIASDVNTYDLQTSEQDAVIVTMDFQPVRAGTFFEDAFDYYCNDAPLQFEEIFDDFEAVKQDALSELTTSG
jgi:hypothetical protein